MAALCKAWVCGRSLAGIVGSNPAECMNVCLLQMLCVVSLCVGLITRPEECYRMWCVWVRSWSPVGESMARNWVQEPQGGGGAGKKQRDSFHCEVWYGSFIQNTLKSPVVNLCTTRFKIQKFYILFRLHVYVLCMGIGTHIEIFFPHASLIDCFF